MAVQIGPKIGIDGEKQYRDAINSIITQAKTLSSEMKVVSTSFDKTTTAEEKSAKKGEVLNKQIKNQEDLVSELNKGLQESIKKYGESDTKTQRWRQAVNNAQADLNTLKNELKENNAELDHTASGMKKASDNASTFGDVLKANLLSDAIKSGFQFLVNAVKGLGDAFKGAVTDSAKFADEIKTLSVTTGLSTKTLQEYAYMADLVDTDLSTVTGSLSKLTRTMASAQSGTKSAQTAFAQLGVSVTDASGNLRSNEEVFGDVITALGSIANETERDALSMQIFGRSAQELNPLIQAGAETLSAFRQEAQDTGYVLGEEQLNKLGALDDAYVRWNNTLDTVKKQIAVGVAPALEKFMEAVQNMVSQIDWEAVGQSLGNLFDKLVDTLATIDLSSVIDTIVASIIAFIDAIAQIDFPALFQGVSDVMSFIQDHGAVVAGAIGAIVAVVTALQIASLATTPAVVALLGAVAPFIAPILAIVGAIAGLIAIIKNWGAISEWLKNTWENVKTAVVTTFNNLKEKVTTAFRNMFEGIRNTVTNIKNAISDAFGRVKETIMGVVNKAWSWGSDLIGGIVNGIKSKFQAIGDAVKGVADKIRSWLHFSRPDEGSLRDYETWMPDFMAGLAKGIKQNTYRVEEAMEGVASAMNLNPSYDLTTSANPATYRQVSPSFSITINGGNATAQEIADEVMNRIELEYERTAYAWQ